MVDFFRDVKQDLGRLVQTEEGAAGVVTACPEFDLPSALSCTAALIAYLELLADEANFNIYKIKTFKFEQVGLKLPERKKEYFSQFLDLFF